MDGSKYLNDWAKGGEAQMLSDFGIGREALDGANILVASYTYESYNGDAYVLFERDGGLWEVHESHCSCYGLSEDGCGSERSQWQPEEAHPEAILHRLAGVWGEEAKVNERTRAAVEDFMRRGLSEATQPGGAS